MNISKIEVDYWEARPYESLDAKRRTDFEVTAWTVNDLIDEIEAMKHHGHKSIRFVAGGIILASFAVFLPFTLMTAFITLGALAIFIGCIISLWE